MTLEHRFERRVSPAEDRWEESSKQEKPEPKRPGGGAPCSTEAGELDPVLQVERRWE